MNIGEVIKKYREDNKINMRDFAEKANVSRSYISILETNSNPTTGKPIIPSIEKMNNIAKAMGMSIDSLLAIIDGEQLISLNDDNITDIYNKLNENRQENVYNFALNELEEQEQFDDLGYLVAQSQIITVYGSVSAGTGEFMSDSEDNAEVEYNGKVPIHDFALQVNGNSMLPLFEDGQYIFVKETINARSGQIVIAYYEGDAYVKKFIKEKETISLVSLNKDYEDIIVTSDDFRILGTVIV